MKKFINAIEDGLNVRQTAIVDDDFPQLLHKFDGSLKAVHDTAKRLKDVKVVCLCGSTKFKDEFYKANKEFTLKGYIVLSVGFFMHTDNDTITLSEKEALDNLHKRKIDLADEVYVINKDGYIGSSTQSEIEYAIYTNKPISYLE